MANLNTDVKSWRSCQQTLSVCTAQETNINPHTTKSAMQKWMT